MTPVVVATVNDSTAAAAPSRDVAAVIVVAANTAATAQTTLRGEKNMAVETVQPGHKNCSHRVPFSSGW